MKKKLTKTETPLFHQRKITEAMQGVSFLAKKYYSQYNFTKNLSSFFVLSIIEANYYHVVSPLIKALPNRSPRISALRYSLLSKLSEKTLGFFFSHLITGIIIPLSLFSIHTKTPPLFTHSSFLCLKPPIFLLSQCLEAFLLV